jgi:hypothetical protein
MKWTVLYRPSAQDHLAQIWLNSPERQTIADAADAIDGVLASNPVEAGESRDGNARIIIEPPLTVLYEVYSDDAVVEAFAIFEWDRHAE